VSETKIRPRLEFEDRPAPRLEALPVPVPTSPTPGTGAGTVTLALAGATVLVLGLAVLDVGNFVAAQFDRGLLLGWLTVAVALGGFGLIGAAIWREIRGLLELGHVDTLRLALADPARTKAAALRWVAELPEGAAVRPSLVAIDDPAAIMALLRAGPQEALHARAEALGRAAALQVFATAAIVPSAALDGLVVAWRGARLVREVAQLYGVRPGLIGTLSLLRRTAFAAASVMATDLAVDAATRAVLSNPLLHHVAGDVAAGGVAARRMILLARAAAAACSPLANT
jgi:putative membrane protein